LPDADIRVGLIGAGGDVRNRHIPGFQKVAGLEILAVANRSLESGCSVADQFNIPGFTAAGKNYWRTMK
jgi:predicted dehydrogenase